MQEKTQVAQKNSVLTILTINKNKNPILRAPLQWFLKAELLEYINIYIFHYPIKSLRHITMYTIYHVLMKNSNKIMHILVWKLLDVFCSNIKAVLGIATADNYRCKLSFILHTSVKLSTPCKQKSLDFLCGVKWRDTMCTVHLVWDVTSGQREEWWFFKSNSLAFLIFWRVIPSSHITCCLVASLVDNPIYNSTAKEAWYTEANSMEGEQH